MKTTENSAEVKPRRKYKKENKAKSIWIRLCKNRGAVVGLIILILIILTSLLCPLFLSYQDDVIAMNVADRLIAPCLEHPFGTDSTGRDMLARIVWGSRYSLTIGFASTAISLMVGGVLGAIAGFAGKRTDMLIMRVLDVIMAIPPVLLGLAVVAALGADVPNLIGAMSISAIPGFARVIRGSVMTVRDQEFVEAARAIGNTEAVTLFSHVIPNSLAPVIVQATLGVAGSILMIAALSFLGLGIAAPIPEWGSLLASGREYIRTASYLAIYPGVAIMITILSLNLLGDGLRDALDPRLK